MLEGVTDAADQIAENAKGRVRVESGDLQNSIHVEAEGSEVRVVAGDDKAWYGHIVEFGAATGQPAQPFLIPAYEMARANIEKIVGEALKDL